jgi:Asp-tRNA(Asn)/Glu-tRNA(Gln) amidotransferase C subunit
MDKESVSVGQPGAARAAADTVMEDDRRRQIESEEELRHAVRRRLDAEHGVVPPAPPPPRDGFGKKVMDFLNSSVGMWLLSSVVLTGGAALIQNIQHQHEVDQKNREQLATHRFEVTHRLDEMEYGLRRAKTVGEAKAAMDGMFKSKFPLTADLQNRSLASLYLTMLQLVNGSDDKKYNEVMDFIRRLEEAELALQSEPDDKPLDAGQREHMRKLLKSVKTLHLNGS